MSDEIVEHARLIHTGEAMVLVAFTAEDLEVIAIGTSGSTRDRALTALALIDSARAAEVMKAIREAGG